MRFDVLTDKENEIAKHIIEIMKLLEIPPTEDNSDTPLRIAKMYSREVFRNRQFDYGELMSQMTLFPYHPLNVKGVKENPVEIKGIKFTSMCSHHWLPFTGYVDISYIPNNNLLGLSKFPRVVKYMSKRPCMQEELTNDIGEFLVNLLNPKYLSVTLRDVKHSCVEARGVESECEVDTYYTYEKEGSHEA